MDEGSVDQAQTDGISTMSTKPTYSRTKLAKRIDVGCHHRNYRQVQRSHRNKRTTAELTTVRSGEWSVNKDKSGHGRRDCEHLESSLAAQLVREKFHATRLLLHTRKTTDEEANSLHRRGRNKNLLRQVLGHGVWRWQTRGNQCLLLNNSVRESRAARTPALWTRRTKRILKKNRQTNLHYV